MESVAAQSREHLEVIVTDDSDKPEDQIKIKGIVEGYSSQGFPCRYVFTKPSLGQAKNTNQGLFAAAGDLVRILHSDDLVRPGCFEWEREQFERFPFMSLLFEDCIPFTDESEIQWCTSPTVRLVDAAEYFRLFLSTSTALPSGTVFRKEVLEECGGMREDWSFLCDWEFFSKALLRSARRREMAAYVRSGNFAWRLHDQSTSFTKWRRHFEEHEQLLEQWNSELSSLDLDLFVSNIDKKNFFRRGHLYRYARLYEDHKKQSPGQRARSLGWVLTQSLKSDYRWAAYKLKVNKRINSIRKGFKSLSSKRQPESKTYTKPIDSAELAKTFYITCLHDDRDIPDGATSVVLPYDNSLNLWGVRLQIEQAARVCIHHVNLNKFYFRTIVETLKHVQIGTKVQFFFHDNNYLTWFGLKAVLETAFPQMFRFIAQNKSPQEGTTLGYSQWIVEFERIAKANAFISAPFSGVTVGVLTLGDRSDELRQLLQSVKAFCHLPYEILLISPNPITEDFRDDRIERTLFTEDDKYGWITRKKNLICDRAKYSEVIVCHDRYHFTNDFFDFFNFY
jgi:glycosyltransferase involved in cell wall biosynthesis